jgi:glycosyltransferase involved in cell wall biosynthesis
VKILFLTISRITDVSARGIYTDLIRYFRDKGHDIYIVSPTERRYRQTTTLIRTDNLTILLIKTLNIQKTNILEKGLSTILIEYQFLNAIKKYLPELLIDLILYSTPPITFTKVISFYKRKCGASSYLLLKDIFPQNAVDLGMIKQNSLVHEFFRRKEMELYAISDYIGCMSPANVEYILIHNNQIMPAKVEVNPNSIEPTESNILTREQKSSIRKKYQIPNNIAVFIYGGNLGKPQGISFLIDVLYSQINNRDVFFVVAGSGTEYLIIESWFKHNKPSNAILLYDLPKDEYDLLMQSCDVGLVFLDKRFTIPNFPSRLLSYLEFKLPFIAATDPNTDLGRIAEENGYGFWSLSGDIEGMNQLIAKLSGNLNLIRTMGESGYRFLLQNYTVAKSYDTIMSHFEQH